MFNLAQQPANEMVLKETHQDVATREKMTWFCEGSEKQLFNQKCGDIYNSFFPSKRLNPAVHMCRTYLILERPESAKLFSTITLKLADLISRIPSNTLIWI